MFARKDLSLEWPEIAGQARNDGGGGNDRGQWRRGLGAAGAEPPPYDGRQAARGGGWQRHCGPGSSPGWRPQSPLRTV